MEIIEDSVEKMDFHDNFFDLVTAIETYYFWSSFPGSLQEIKRVLKPCGMPILNEMMKDGVYELKRQKSSRKPTCDLSHLTKSEASWNPLGLRIFKSSLKPSRRGTQFSLKSSQIWSSLNSLWMARTAASPSFSLTTKEILSSEDPCAIIRMFILF